MKKFTILFVLLAIAATMLVSGCDWHVPTGQNAAMIIKTLLDGACRAGNVGLEKGYSLSYRFEVSEEATVDRCDGRFIWVGDGWLEYYIGDEIVDSVSLTVEVQWISGDPKSYDSWGILFFKTGSKIVVDNRGWRSKWAEGNETTH